MSRVQMARGLLTWTPLSSCSGYRGDPAADSAARPIAAAAIIQTLTLLQIGSPEVAVPAGCQPMPH